MPKNHKSEITKCKHEYIISEWMNGDYYYGDFRAGFGSSKGTTDYQKANKVICKFCLEEKTL